VRMFDMNFYEKNKDAIREDAKEMLFTMSDSRMAIFTDTGVLHQFRMKDVPLCKLKDKGVPLDNISNYDSGKENILKLCCYDELKDKTLLFVSARAMMKRVSASEFDSVKKTVASTKLADGDSLVYVDEIRGSDTVLVSREGYVLRFGNEDVPEMKKTSVGVRGMKLKDDDVVQAVYDLDPSVKYLVKIKNRRVDLSGLKKKKRDQKAETV